MMNQPSAPDSSLSLMLIEAGLTVIALAAALCWPRLARSWFSRIERAFGRFAKRKTAAVVTKNEN